MTSTRTIGRDSATLRVQGWDGSSLVAGTLGGADPLGFAADDANLYRYVGNDPTDEVDPTGLFGESPYNTPIPGVKTPEGDIGPIFPGGQTPFMIPNKPTNLGNSIFFIGPPTGSLNNQDGNDTYMLKAAYLKALGVPSQNIFYYNGSNGLKKATQDACKLGLKNPDVFFWGHGRPGGLLVGNPGFPGYDGPRKDGKYETIDNTSFNTFAGLIPPLGPSRTTILACNFLGTVPPANFVGPPYLPGLPLLNDLTNTTGAPSTGLVGLEAPYLVNGKWGWYLQNGGNYITIK